MGRPNLRPRVGEGQGQCCLISDKLKVEQDLILVPTLPRGNGLFDAPRRLRPRRSRKTAETRSVQDRCSHAGT